MSQSLRELQYTQVCHSHFEEQSLEHKYTHAVSYPAPLLAEPSLAQLNQIDPTLQFVWT